MCFFVQNRPFLKELKGDKRSYRFARPSDRELKADSLVDVYVTISRSYWLYLLRLEEPITPLTPFIYLSFAFAKLKSTILSTIKSFRCCASRNWSTLRPSACCFARVRGLPTGGLPCCHRHTCPIRHPSCSFRPQSSFLRR